MLIDRSSFSQHIPWIIASLAVAALATVWFFAASAGGTAWPPGNSAPGLVFGLLGGGICFFEFLLWPRKKYRAWRIGRTQAWMRAHIWLGLLAVPLLVYHSGFRWGGALSTVVMALFLVVIASGVWGLVLQQFVPTKMLKDLPAETIYSQIDHISQLLSLEAEKLVLATCGTESGLKPTEASEVSEMGTEHMVVGKVRQAGGVQGMVIETLAPSMPVVNSEQLAESFMKEIRPYLQQGRRSGSALATRAGADHVFNQLRTRVNPEAYPVVGRVEELCYQRRQFDTQERLHFWLHSWLLVHLPLSAALIVLMFVHVFVALKYW